jgi:hypothetical protein
MVFNLENSHIHKRILLLILISLLIISTLSQFFPVNAQTPEATLTGAITDTGVDTDGDGLFNFLNIGVEVNVTSAGTFQVEVLGLYDQENNYYEISNTTLADLDIGIHLIDVLLDGEEIRDFGVNVVSVVAVYLDIESEEADAAFELALSREYAYTEFQTPTLVVDYQIDTVDREIVLDPKEIIHIINVYSITNRGDELETIDLSFPENAYDIKVRDDMGNLDFSEGTETVKVNLRRTVATNETLMIFLSYHFPWKNYITQQNGIDYKLHFTFYENFNWTIQELIVSVKLPEGAKFYASTPIEPSSIENSGLQDTVTFDFSDVTPSEDLNFEINYRYLLFWSSFYPTIWVGILTVIVSAFAILWNVPKPSAAMIAQFPPDDLKSFVDAYEEKIRIKSHLESMESRLHKGKISRRRYKVRKKMLDGRISTISRNLSSLHDKIRAAGPKYANMMRQLEVAETNLEGAERDIQRVEARYKRGEVSKGAYAKLMDEYKHRSEEAEATIDGVILRLKDEIR